MKKALLVLLGCGLFATAKAQQSEISQLGCGTITAQSDYDAIEEFMKSYADLEKYDAKGTAELDTVPVTVIIVADDNGNGRYPLNTLFEVMCKLNQKYIPVGFHFAVKWPIKYVNNTSYYDHNYTTGAQLMYQNNVANTVNIYFVQNPSGACGYYTYGPDAIAIGKNCAGVNNTTVAHEVGHYMGLPHTFSGWENGATPNNPEKVTRGTGANCSSTGDRFCDTDADYLGERWNCPYNDVKYDVNGDRYHPDSSLYMSYSTDACMSRFSNQQIASMRNRLTGTGNNNRRNLLNNAGTYGVLGNTLNFLNSSNTMYANDKKISWSKVDNADMYFVRITPTQYPTLVRDEFITSDTFVIANNATVNNNNYTVHVYPMNGANVCRSNVYQYDYLYLNTTDPNSIGTVEALDNSIQLYPNPSENGELNLSISGLKAQKIEANFYSVTGSLIANQAIQYTPSQSHYPLTLSDLSSGVYYLKLSVDGTTVTKKVVIN